MFVHHEEERRKAAAAAAAATPSTHVGTQAGQHSSNGVSPCSRRHPQRQTGHNRDRSRSVGPRAAHLVRQGADGRAKRAREPEVCELELSVPADQQILRLQVAAERHSGQEHKTSSARSNVRNSGTQRTTNSCRSGGAKISLHTRPAYVPCIGEGTHARHTGTSTGRACCANEQRLTRRPLLALALLKNLKGTRQRRASTPS